MYKTEITTRQDIEKAISVMPKGVEDQSGTNMANSSLLLITPAEAEFVIETLEICANKFPEAK